MCLKPWVFLLSFLNELFCFVDFHIWEFSLIMNNKLYYFIILNLMMVTFL